MSFEKIALPSVVERGLGIQVMKSLGNGKLLTAMTARDCIHYALSLPAHCIALGFTSLDHVEEDVRSARECEPLTAEEMDRLRARAAKVAGPGAHKAVRALAESDRDKYEYMWRLQEDLHTVDVGDQVELEPKCGDILFFAHFCVHAASDNVRDTPRLALRSRW